jgi:hypothetical protein
MIEGSGSGSGSIPLFKWIQIQEAKKHADPVDPDSDPDPQQWSREILWAQKVDSARVKTWQIVGEISRSTEDAESCGFFFIWQNLHGRMI